MRCLRSNRRLAAAATLCAALLGRRASAQEPSSLRQMTLPEALQYARQHQPSLLAAQARIAVARANAEVPRAQWAPRLAATAQAFLGTANNSTASYLGSPGVDLVRIGGTRVLENPEWVPDASTLIGVGVRQEVFDFGRIAAQASAGDALTSVEAHRADVDRLDVDLSVASAFYAVTAARAILQAAQAATHRAQVNRDAAAAGVQSGLRRPIDLTKADADLARFDVAQIRAEASLEAAQALLAAAVGINESRLDATGELPPLAALPTLDELLKTARQRDPGIAAATSTVEAQEANTRALATSQRPDLQLSASASTRAGGATPSGGPATAGYGLLPIVPNYDAGLILSWPLYDGVVRQQQSASARQEQVRREELAAARLKLDVSVQQSWLEAHLADEALPALERSVDAAHRNEDQAQARYKAGLATSLELADAEDLQVEAEIQLAVGRFQQARARARLSRAIAEGL